MSWPVPHKEKLSRTRLLPEAATAPTKPPFRRPPRASLRCPALVCGIAFKTRVLCLRSFFKYKVLW